jgi:hypothetical protein
MFHGQMIVNALDHSGMNLANPEGDPALFDPEQEIIV